MNSSLSDQPAPASSVATWFAEEVQPHEHDLRAFLHRRFPSSQEVDDLVQESYARVIRARQTRVIAEPRAYLFRTARNVALDLFRKTRPVSLDGLEETARLSVVEESPDAAEAASHAQEMALLTESITRLPERCREIVMLRKIHGMAYREIAERLGITESTVNAQLAIGMVRCRQFLQAKGVLKGDI